MQTDYESEKAPVPPPADWDTIALGQGCSLIKDGTHLPPPRVEDGPYLLSVQNLIDGQLMLTPSDTKVPWEFYRSMHGSWQICVGDVLLAIVGATLGKSATVPSEMPPFTLQRSVAILRGKDGVLHSRYLFHCITTASFQQSLWQRANQTAQPGVYLGDLAQLTICVPRFNEQQEIANILDTADDAIRQTEALTAKLRLQKRGLMNDLLSGRIRV
jgi:type I restriction enzyme, S subunit